jgi:farnesyl diphosphate synthase
MAINDSFLLETFIYRIIKKYFRTEPYYLQLIELFHEVTFQTELGQLMDLITAPENDIDLTRFTPDRHTLIVEYKTAYYSFYLPVALALLMAGKTEESGDDFKNAKDILIPMGIFFQVQDDYLDCFGNPETIGKIGTDIEDNKCSWLVVQALKRATPQQKRVIEDNYGQADPQKVQTIKALYREMQLPELFAQYEESSYAEIEKLISGIDRERKIPAQVFLDFAKKIYKRQK